MAGDNSIFVLKQVEIDLPWMVINHVVYARMFVFIHKAHADRTRRRCDVPTPFGRTIEVLPAVLEYTRRILPPHVAHAYIKY